jgi:ubiquitin carboxyl-terminal hydrolase 5/13
MNDVSKGGRLYLHEKWTQVKKSEETSNEPVSKLVIKDEDNFEVIKEHALVVYSDNKLNFVPLPNSSIPEFLLNVIQSVIDHDGMKAKLQSGAWDGKEPLVESKYARNLVQLDNGVKISHDPTTWKCAESGDTSNLWLNLSTGYIGGGRKNWDGSGGSGAALKHFQDTGGHYPLCVKLGTITPYSADVWSYAPSEDCLVEDPLLPQHLSHWGINIMKLEKTDKSLIEMEEDLNITYDWSRMMEGGEQLELLRGPGLIGLQNIGSSCYLSSVVQSIFSIPEVNRFSYLFCIC